ncbi:TonB family protein [Hymenobacter sp. BT186]|uniref:TonB family protein n=1 Tax=Hymenobacter telluris TaxID=2816474 RepID=A0A939EW76_9BACT|nr:M56 family metallopeptidase [Hymenobacter telluris]MBO0358321.1 TonB family protein [Hymenobacter telluris]MBW3374347.1 TonB family protein [Hymenobacter norwichensis]
MTTPALLNWMWQSTLCLGACWLLYWLALRRETHFHYNRQFLRYTPWLALLLPPILTVLAPKLGSWLPSQAAPSALLAPAFVLPTAVVSTTGISPTYWGWLPLVYVAGVGLGVARLGWQVFRLWQTTRRLPRQPRAGYTLVSTSGQLPISSFGRFVFWDETADLAPTEAQQVLCHELVHVQQGHTWEQLHLRVLQVVLWFNPFVHGYPRALALTHEYLADAAVLAAAAPSTTPATYVALLARLALRRLYPNLPLPHSFTHSPILTRIAMLQSSPRVRRWKQWLILPVSAVLLVTISCEKAAEPTAPTATSSDSHSMPPPPPPPAVYAFAEHMPEYAGGMTKLLTDITQQLRYPAAALKAELEGKVFVDFIIASDGSMQAVSLKKGISAPANMAPAAQAMNEAALDAVRNLPGTWTPGSQDGKQVAVSYTVPIAFTLNQAQVKLPNQKIVSVTYPAQQQ